MPSNSLVFATFVLAFSLSIANRKTFSSAVPSLLEDEGIVGTNTSAPLFTLEMAGVINSSFGSAPVQSPLRLTPCILLHKLLSLPS